MKNTTNKMTRKIAAILAAVMTVTTMASFTASADSTAPNTPFTAETAVKMGTNTLYLVFEEFVPGGKLISPYIKLFANDLMGNGKDLSLDDINARIEELFDKVDSLNDDLRDSIANITALQSFDSFQFKTFNAQISEIVSQIRIIRDLDIPEETKYARIAALVNDSSCWAEANNVFVTFNGLTQALNRASLVKKGDIFAIVYGHFAKSSVFSGEALEKAKPVVDLIMTDYMAGCCALIQCLAAQLKVCNMTAEEKSRIDPKYLSRITDEEKLIFNKVNEITEAVIGKKTEETVRVRYQSGTTLKQTRFGFERKPVYKYRETTVVKFDDTGIRGRYNAFVNTPANILVNKDTASTELAARIFCKYTDGLAQQGVPVGADTVAKRFNGEIASRQALTGDQVRAVASAAAAKGLTIREYLRQNGFNTDYLPAGALLTAGKAYDDILSVSSIAANFIGSIVTHAYVKAYNIDEKDPAEREVVLWNTGIHTIGFDGWSFGDRHCIAVIEKVQGDTDYATGAEIIARNITIW